MSMNEIKPVHQHLANPNSLPKFISVAFVILQTCAFLFSIVQCNNQTIHKKRTSRCRGAPEAAPEDGSARPNVRAGRPSFPCRHPIKPHGHNNAPSWKKVSLYSAPRSEDFIARSA